jgi:superfamily II DNA or RNA helicase
MSASAEREGVLQLVGSTIRLPGHFTGPVQLEDVREMPGAVQLRVRTPAGSLEETLLSDAELASIEVAEAAAELVDADAFFDLIEAHRIDLAYSHDPMFAVSLCGVRGLPHQIEAVYRKMLPQAWLRFVLADDPGAGKTIMAGLLAKELQLRGVADRILVLCPAPLTPQWQAELAEKFEEHFDVFDAARVKWQPGGNPWAQTDRVITSIDFAKREEVMPDLLRADWDLVVIDEAHKASATTRWDAEEQREKLDATRRYRLAEELSRRSERLLLMTATPHSGDPERFRNFLRLLDPDQFSEKELAVEQIARDESPHWIRRQKEDLKDEHGRDLFVPREVLTQPFELSPSELHLYHEVTEYIREFLGNIPGRKGTAVALARTVFQRRLASSLGAIRSSLHKRANRIEERIDEIEKLPPNERAKRMAELRLIDALDPETDPDDATEEQENAAVEDVVVAESIDRMQVEVTVLRELTRLADETIERDEERKLTALRDCLAKAELAELRDGRGKLLIFTEHRDTLDYLERHLREWGYDTCSIHGGLNPRARRDIQRDFADKRQICIATEAAGEGINLQFCHLMINYDLPWNPVRLEQRMGRIHRIGQTSKCVIFNFCATNTVEGKLLLRLLEKIEEMKEALGGRVYDVIGEVLAQNQLDFEGLLRDALVNPGQVDPAEQEIESIDPDRLKEYERAIGVAQATKHVDLSWVSEQDYRSEERRLMPEYVEQFFDRAAGRVSMKVDRRADDLLRIEHVPQALRDERLAQVKRLGRPEASYRKATFRKERRDEPRNSDAILLSPGHPLYAATCEVLLERLEPLVGSVAPFVAPWARAPFSIHFFSYSVIGHGRGGKPEAAFAELVGVTAEDDGEFSLVGADVLHDLTPLGFVPDQEATPQRSEIEAATDHVRAEAQLPQVAEARSERLGQSQLRTEYLRRSMDAHLKREELKAAELDDRIFRGDESARLARDQAYRRIADIERRKEARLAEFEQLGIVRAGPVSYLGSALVFPPPENDRNAAPMRNDPEVEQAAMGWAMQFEREQGWEPEDVSGYRDGRGFDIRSVKRDPAGRVLDIRRIEVKGRGPSSGDVSLCRTEWIAAQRHREGFWLYVVYGAKSNEPRPVRIRDPYATVGEQVEEATTVTAYRVPASAIEAAR